MIWFHGNLVPNTGKEMTSVITEKVQVTLRTELRDFSLTGFVVGMSLVTPVPETPWMKGIVKLENCKVSEFINAQVI